MSVEETLYELGVDISSSFSFHDGDIVLAEYDDNLVQAITNRLETDLDELDLLYENYGSVMFGFLGWRGNDETLGFMKSELDTVLKSEPRLSGWDYEIEYTGDGNVRIDLRLYPNPGYRISTTLLLSNTGIEVVEA